MSSVPFKRPRFRIILPVTYFIVAGFLFAVCILNMGHSRFCQYAFYSMLPAGLIGPALSYLLGPDRIAQHGFLVWLLEFTQVPLPFLLTCLQYYLIGLLLDQLLEYRSRVSSRS
jgi:hypothetical protein